MPAPQMVPDARELPTALSDSPDAHPSGELACHVPHDEEPSRFLSHTAHMWNMERGAALHTHTHTRRARPTHYAHMEGIRHALSERWMEEGEKHLRPQRAVRGRPADSPACAGRSRRTRLVHAVLHVPQSRAATVALATSYARGRSGRTRWALAVPMEGTRRGPPGRGARRRRKRPGCERAPSWRARDALGGREARNGLRGAARRLSLGGGSRLVGDGRTNRASASAAPWGIDRRAAAKAPCPFPSASQDGFARVLPHRIGRSILTQAVAALVRAAGDDESRPAMRSGRMSRLRLARGGRGWADESMTMAPNVDSRSARSRDLQESMPSSQTRGADSR